MVSMGRVKCSGCSTSLSLVLLWALLNLSNKYFTSWDDAFQEHGGHCTSCLLWYPLAHLAHRSSSLRSSCRLHTALVRRVEQRDYYPSCTFISTHSRMYRQQGTFSLACFSCPSSPLFSPTSPFSSFPRSFLKRSYTTTPSLLCYLAHLLPY